MSIYGFVVAQICVKPYQYRWWNIGYALILETGTVCSVTATVLLMSVFGTLALYCEENAMEILTALSIEVAI